MSLHSLFAGTVRVTLVQTPIGSGKSTVSQPTLMSTGSSSQPIYKPVTITAQQAGQATVGVGGAGGIRTSINATTLVPTPLSVGTFVIFLSNVVQFCVLSKWYK